MIQAITLGQKKYKLNPNQVKVINKILDDNLRVREDAPNEVAFYGAFRCGKSFIFQLMCFLIAGNYPNLNILYVRATYNQLIDSVVKQFNNDFGLYGQFTYKITTRQAIFNNGSVINFRAYDMDKNAILSNEYDASFICQAEDIQEEVFLQILGRMSGSKLPKRLVFTEGNPASTWPKVRYKDATPEELEKRSIYFIEGDTYDNESNLPEGYIDNLLKNYPKNWIDRYVYGGWDQIDEMVFNEFRESKNVIELINVGALSTHYKKRIFMDYGWVNPTALLWAYLDYDGRLVIYDEFFDTKQLPEEIYKVHIRHEPSVGRCPVVVDYAIKNVKTGTEMRRDKTLWDDLMELGMALVPSNKDKLRNIVDANMLFKQGRLLITRNCVNLIREIKNYKWKRLKLGEEKNHPEEPIKKDDHGIDAMLYGIADLEELRSISPQKSNYEDSLKAKTIEYPQRDWRDLG